MLIGIQTVKPQGPGYLPPNTGGAGSGTAPKPSNPNTGHPDEWAGVCNNVLKITKHFSRYF